MHGMQVEKHNPPYIYQSRLQQLTTATRPTKVGIFSGMAARLLKSMEGAPLCISNLSHYVGEP